MRNVRSAFRPIAASCGLAFWALSAQAVDAVYLDRTVFLAAAPGAAMESFESLPGRVRSASPIVSPLMTLVPGVGDIGVQTGPLTPSDGFGAFAVDGTNYVSVYAPNVPAGSLTFNLAAPSTVFGLSITDAGEVAGRISMRTDAGAFAGGVTLLDFSTGQGNGQLYFIGLSQDQPFTQVVLSLTGPDEAYGVDGVYVNAVPEPASAWIWGGGLLGLGAWLRRNRRPH